MIDSRADFSARAKEIGVSDAELRNLEALGVDSFGKLAFASNFIPGQSDETSLLRLAKDITGVDPVPVDRLPLIRRLVFESYTLAAADLRMRLDRKDDDQPRKLAQAERSARYAEQAKRLKGLSMTGELEPSNSLIDLVYNMAEEGNLKYVKWEECTKRDQELMGVKTDPVWKADSSGVIRESKVQEALKAEFDSDLKLRYALQRRSLAFDQSRLIDYEAFEAWTQVLMEAYTAPAMEGYQKVSIEQVHKADLELFKYMMRETRSGIKVVGGVQPLAQALKDAIRAPEVRLYLQPLQGGIKRKPEAALEEPKKNKQPATSENEKLKRHIENLQNQVKNLQSRSSSSKGSQQTRTPQQPKGRGKTKTRLIRMPARLIGLNPVTANGEPKCFDFNLDGCTLCKPGEKCVKGWHLCMQFNCDQPHSQADHR